MRLFFTLLRGRSLKILFKKMFLQNKILVGQNDNDQVYFGCRPFSFWNAPFLVNLYELKVQNWTWVVLALMLEKNLSQTYFPVLFLRVSQFRVLWVSQFDSSLGPPVQCKSWVRANSYFKEQSKHVISLKLVE